MKTVFTLFILLFACLANTFATNGTPLSEATIDTEKTWTILVYEYNENMHTSVVSKELDCSDLKPLTNLNVVACSHVAPTKLNQTLSRITREYNSRLIPYSQAARELGLQQS